MKFIRPDESVGDTTRKTIDRSRYTNPTSEIALLERAQRRERNEACLHHDDELTGEQRSALDRFGVRLDGRHSALLEAQRLREQAPGAAPPAAYGADEAAEYDDGSEMSGVHVEADEDGATCATCEAPLGVDGHYQGETPDHMLRCPSCGAPVAHHGGSATPLDESGGDADHVAALRDQFGQVQCGGCHQWWQLREHAIPRECQDPACRTQWSIRDVHLSAKARAHLRAVERRNRSRLRETEL